MVGEGRRNDLKLVKEIIRYLKRVDGTATQGELCATVGINSKTAEKWLTIFQLIKKECPVFGYGKVGRYRVISTGPFTGSRSEVAATIKHFFSERGIEASTYQEELIKAISMGTTDFEHVEPRLESRKIEDGDEFRNKYLIKGKRASDYIEKRETNMNLQDLRKGLKGAVTEGTNGFEHVKTKTDASKRKAVLHCDKCGVEQELPVHCGDQMRLEKAEFICSECGLKTPVSTHCGESMKIMIK
ncbi:MAG: hypothetical protein ACFFCZ_14530 [Promethearchaeota archaeon]